MPFLVGQGRRNRQGVGGAFLPCGREILRQNRNVLELLTACCRARLDGSTSPSLLPREAELVTA